MCQFNFLIIGMFGLPRYHTGELTPRRAFEGLGGGPGGGDGGSLRDLSTNVGEEPISCLRLAPLASCAKELVDIVQEGESFSTSSLV